MDKQEMVVTVGILSVISFFGMLTSFADGYIFAGFLMMGLMVLGISLIVAVSKG